MGLFDILFGKKESESKPEVQGDNVSYKEDWAFYFSNVDDVIGSFYVDLGLSKIAPATDKPNLVWISVKMNNPRDNGLSSSEEFDALSAIEDRLQEFIFRNHSSIYAGRLTSNSKTDFYFYFGDTALYDKTISEAMVAFPSYTYDFGIKEDAEWNSYLNFIYPNPRQFQSIQNRRVIDNLEKNGDPLTKARRVDHWIYFKTHTDRAEFLDKIEQLKFDIVSKDKKTSSGDSPYKLHISRIDNVDIDSVDNYVLELWEKATECNGDYDGWETSVERTDELHRLNNELLLINLVAVMG
jgi:uncharacterized protein (TIGR01619 family)